MRQDFSNVEFSKMLYSLSKNDIEKAYRIKEMEAGNFFRLLTEHINFLEKNKKNENKSKLRGR